VLIIYFHILVLRKQLLIVCDKYGRLGNRLFLFAQLIEFSRKSGREIWMPGFHDCSCFFETTQNSRFFRYPQSRFNVPNPFSGIISFYAFNKISKITEKINTKYLFKNLVSFSHNDGNPFKKINSSLVSCILFNGFIFHQHFLDLHNSLPTIRTVFKPSSKFTQLIEGPIRDLRKKSQIIVGVLVRQTDYREWNDGKSFFTSFEYARILERLSISLNEETTSFFIASDENQDDKTFENFVCTVRVGFPIENLYSLAMCDLLIGPTSSYMGWAALYGDVPSFTIQSSDDSPTKEDFI
jgi:hypothetical protein